MKQTRNVPASKLLRMLPQSSTDVVLVDTAVWGLSAATEGAGSLNLDCSVDLFSRSDKWQNTQQIQL